MSDTNTYTIPGFVTQSGVTLDITLRYVTFGRLAPGAWADVVRLDRDLQLSGVIVEGESIDLDDAR